MINQAIIEKHAELANDLWLRRSHAVTAPNYTLADVGRVDARLEANLEALLLAGNIGFQLCSEQLDRGSPQGVFVLAYLAQMLGQHAEVDALLGAVSAEAELVPGFLDGLGFAMLSSSSAGPHGSTSPVVSQRVSGWLASSELPTQTVALRLASALRHTDLPCLQGEWPFDDVAWLRAATRAVSLLGAVDQLPKVYPLLQHADLDLRIEAALCVVRLRGAMRQQALSLLDEIARLPKHPLSLLALVVSLRARDKTASEHYALLRSSLDPLRRHMAAAAVGTAALVDELIADCRDPALSRTAAHALALITGVDLAYADLEGDAPPGAAPLPASTESDAPDPEGAAEPKPEDQADPPGDDPVDDMAWPDGARVEAWWSKERARFATDQRLLGGHPIASEGLRKVLKSAHQPARIEASWELALRDHAPLFNTALPARMQRGLL